MWFGLKLATKWNILVFESLFLTKATILFSMDLFLLEGNS